MFYRVRATVFPTISPLCLGFSAFFCYKSATMALALRTNFIWMVTGQAIFSGTQFLNLILLAHLGGPSQVGAYTLALAITTPIITLAALSLRTVFVTTDDHPFKNYYKINLLTLVPAFIGFSLWAYLGNYSSSIAWVIFWVGVSKMFESLSDVAYGLPHKHERMDKIAKSIAIRGVLSTSLLGLVFYTTQNLALSFAVYAAVWALIYWFIDQRFITTWVKEKVSLLPIEPIQLKPLFWLALPMGLSAFLNIFANSIPRYEVERVLGTDALGIFASMAYLIIIGNMVINSLGQTVRPRFARHYKAKEVLPLLKIIGVGGTISVSLGLAFVICAAMLGEWVLIILYGQEFANNLDIFNAVAWASTGIYLGGYLTFVLSATNAFKLVLTNQVITTIFVLAAAFYLIPIYQLNGAVYALFAQGISNSLLNILGLIYVIHKKVKES